MEKENIFEVLSDEIFTDREEVLNYFWELIKEYIPRFIRMRKFNVTVWGDCLEYSNEPISFQMHNSYLGLNPFFVGVYQSDLT
ncbi:MAG: hypothetical protein ACE5KT_09695 [Methanosarcinales archaeon]